MSALRRARPAASPAAAASTSTSVPKAKPSHIRQPQFVEPDQPQIVERQDLPTFDSIRPTRSGQSSGRDAAERARLAGTEARKAQAAAQAMFDKLLAARSAAAPAPSPPSKAAVPSAGRKPAALANGGDGSVDDEAMHTFKLLDTDGNGFLDLKELARGVRKVEADGGVALLQRIDISMDGKISPEEWRTHFNSLASSAGRDAAVKLLKQLDDAAERIVDGAINVGSDGSVKFSLFAS